MQPVKLNLGCGAKILDGFINVDMADNWSGKAPDVVCDLRALTFPDAYADEVHAYHVLEHFYRWESDAVVKEWARVLKPGGLMVIEVPCMEKVVTYIYETGNAREPIQARMASWAMYGDPRYRDPAMVHRWLWSLADLPELLRDCGLVDVKIDEPQTHIKARDMRAEARKP